MAQCCIDTTDAYFDEKWVTTRFQRYKKKGPTGTTAKLISFLRRQHLAGYSLLDVGGGFGTIGHELVGKGLSEVIEVEMSQASMHLAQGEAERRGYADRLRLVHGDLTDPDLEVADGDVVTLDRVICCYPNADGLIRTALSKCRHLFGISYPKSGFYMRAEFFLENLQRRLKKQDFRTFIHPSSEVRALISNEGFTPVIQDSTILWHIELYQRSP